MGLKAELTSAEGGAKRIRVLSCDEAAACVALGWAAAARGSAEAVEAALDTGAVGGLVPLDLAGIFALVRATPWPTVEASAVMAECLRKGSGCRSALWAPTAVPWHVETPRRANEGTCLSLAASRMGGKATACVYSEQRAPRLAVVCCSGADLLPEDGARLAGGAYAPDLLACSVDGGAKLLAMTPIPVLA